MKKLLMLLLVTANLATAQQVSDLVIDSAVWNQTANVYDFIASPYQLYCGVNDLIHPGRNVTLTANLVLANMGPGTAHLGVANVTPGVTWDSCHGYNYYYDFCHFRLTDINGCVLAETEKALYDVSSGQRYLSSGDPNFTARFAWLSGFGLTMPYVNYLNSTMDSGMTTDAAPILYAGFRDTYSSSQYGNWLPIDDALYYLTVGDTIFFSIEIDPYFLDEGANAYPNKVTAVLRWEGLSPVDNKYHVSLIPFIPFPPPAPIIAPTPPVTVSATNNRVISWSGAQNATSYSIQRYCVGCIPGFPGNYVSISGPAVTDNASPYVDNLAVPGYNYYWTVKSMNCAGVSAPKQTKKVRINH